MASREVLEIWPPMPSMGKTHAGACLHHQTCICCTVSQRLLAMCTQLGTTALPCACPGAAARAVPPRRARAEPGPGSAARPQRPGRASARLRPWACAGPCAGPCAIAWAGCGPCSGAGAFGRAQESGCRLYQLAALCSLRPAADRWGAAPYSGLPRVQKGILPLVGLLWCPLGQLGLLQPIFWLPAPVPLISRRDARGSIYTWNPAVSTLYRTSAAIHGIIGS